MASGNCFPVFLSRSVYVLYQENKRLARTFIPGMRVVILDAILANVRGCPRITLAVPGSFAIYSCCLASLHGSRAASSVQGMRAKPPRGKRGGA